MTNEEIELKRKFDDWTTELCYELLQFSLFQPIGLELTCTSVILETRSDYSLSGLENSELAAELYPLAFYRPDTGAIHIFIEHAAFLKRTKTEEKRALLMFLLIHEVNHKLLMHAKRREERDSFIWNIAADFEVHNVLFTYYNIAKNMNLDDTELTYVYLDKFISSWVFEHQNPELGDFLFDECYVQNVAEEIYNDLYNSKEEKKMKYSVNLNSDKKSNDSSSNEENEVTVTVATYTMKNGKKFTTTEVEFPKLKEPQLSAEEKNEKDNNELVRKTLMENSLQKFANDCLGRNRGDFSERCGKFLKKLFRVKIDWKKILRSSIITSLEKSDYFSWAHPRTSLFAMPNAPYLPGQREDESAYGTVVIARDESGSISDNEISQAASIIMEAKEYYKNVIIIKHDTLITSINEFDEINDDVKNLLLTRDSKGGTSHQKVFEWIRDFDRKHNFEERISCCIFITDMQSDIAECQDILNDKIPRIWLYPSAVDDYVQSKCKSIIGRKIKIEA